MSEDLKDAIRKARLKEQIRAARQQPETDLSSKLESGRRGFFQGASLGFKDELDGALEAVGSKIGLRGLGGGFDEIRFETDEEDKESFKDVYSKRRDESRRRDKQAEVANPKSYMVGDITGSVILPGPAGKGKLATTVAKMAGIGAAQGFGRSEAEDAKGLLKDTATSASISGALPVVTKGMGKLADKLSTKLDKTADFQSAKALGVDKAAFKRLGEDRVRAIGRGALDNEIVTPFATTNKMVSRAEALADEGGDLMEKAYTQADMKGPSFNPLEAASKIDEELGGFYRSPINKAETNQLENTLESVLMRGDKDIPLKEAQRLKMELKKVAYPNGRKINPDLITDKQRMAQDAYRIVNKQIDEAAERVGGSETRALLGEGKAKFGAGSAALDLLDEKIAKREGNRFVSPSDWGAGITAAAASTVLGPSAAAIPVVKKIADAFGNQWTATSANKMSKILQNPTYAAIFNKAVGRSPAAVTAVHHTLLKNDKEYQDLWGRD